MRSKLFAILLTVLFAFAVTGATPAFAAKGARKTTTTQPTGGKKHKHKHKGNKKHQRKHHKKHNKGNKGGKKNKTTSGANT
jgi:IMP dehydrogenase/GMP reductase